MSDSEVAVPPTKPAAASEAKKKAVCVIQKAGCGAWRLEERYLRRPGGARNFPAVWNPGALVWDHSSWVRFHGRSWESKLIAC